MWWTSSALSEPESKLAHATLLCGGNDETRRAAALELAMALVCQAGGSEPCHQCSHCRKTRDGIHPDVQWLAEETVPVSVVRTLRADAYIRPNEAMRKVYVVEHGEGLNLSGQNALLKLLEEGPPFAAFLLLTRREGGILPTVRSRCQLVRLAEAPPPLPDPQLAQQADALVAGLLGRNEWGLLSLCVGLEKLNRAQMGELLQLVRQRLRSAPHEGRAILSLFPLLDRLSSALESNVGVGHVAGWLCAGATGEL